MAFSKAYLRRQAPMGFTSDANLMLALDMQAVDGVVSDLSGNSNHATVGARIISSNDNFYRSLLLNDYDSGLLVGDTAGLRFSSQITISMWCFAITLNHATGGVYPRLIDKNKYVIFVRDTGAITFATYGVSTISLITSASVIVTNKWNHLVGTYNASTGVKRLYVNNVLINEQTGLTNNITDSTSYDLFIGYSSISGKSWFGKISWLKLFNTAKDSTWVSSEYERGAQALFRGDWGASISSTPQTAYLENTPCRIGSGTFSVVEDTIESTPVKAIQCDTDGYLAIPYGFYNLSADEAAYGNFEGWIYKELDASDIYILFVSSANVAPDDATQNGYAILFSSTEAIKILKITAGSATVLASTADTAFALQTWYKFKIRRMYNGQIALYLDDTLVTVASGTNPIIDTDHTSSNFFGLSCYAGDKFAWAGKFDYKQFSAIDSGGDNHCFIKRILP
jgi:hypothetical protein